MALPNQFFNDQSSSLEQDAYPVVSICRPKVYKEKTKGNLESNAEIIVAKHRSGPKGINRLSYQNQYGCTQYMVYGIFQ